MEEQYILDPEPMPRRGKWVVWAILAAVFVLALWLFVFDGTEKISKLIGKIGKNNDSQDVDESQGQNVSNTVKTSASSNVLGDASYPLHWGSKGQQVKTLQQICLNNGISVGSSGADGIWGKNTEAAMQQLSDKDSVYANHIHHAGSRLQVTSESDYDAIVILSATSDLTTSDLIGASVDYQNNLRNLYGY